MKTAKLLTVCLRDETERDVYLHGVLSYKRLLTNSINYSHGNYFAE